MDLVREVDIRPGVLQSLEAKHDLAIWFMKENLPSAFWRSFHEFAATKDSDMYAALLAKQTTYRSFVLRKPLSGSPITSQPQSPA